MHMHVPVPTKDHQSYREMHNCAIDRGALNFFKMDYRFGLQNAYKSKFLFYLKLIEVFLRISLSAEIIERRCIPTSLQWFFVAVECFNIFMKENLKLTRKRRLLLSLRVVHNIENRWNGSVDTEHAAYHCLEYPPWKDKFPGWGRGGGGRNKEINGRGRVLNSAWTLKLRYTKHGSTICYSFRFAQTSLASVYLQNHSLLAWSRVHALCTYQYR